MKKFYVGSLFVLALFGFAFSTKAAGYDWFITMNDSSGTVNTSTPLAVPGDSNDRTLCLDGASKTSKWCAGGTGVIIQDGYISLAHIAPEALDPFLPFLGAVAVSTSSLQSQITSLSASQSSFASAISSEIAGIGSTTPIVEVTRAQTNTSGTYTWTFPMAFASGTVPVIEATPEDATVSASVDVRVTALTSTSVTVQASRLTTVLGILTLNATPQIFVHLEALQQ